MPERDPQFEQEVRRIVYEALADREALAAAMAGQKPTPVPESTPREPAAPARSRPGPFEVGVQGGAFDATGGANPPQRARGCTHDKYLNVEDMFFDDDDKVIDAIARELGEPRSRVIQELQRRALRAQVPDLRRDVEQFLGKKISV
jgi:hypothetical protein